MAFQRQNWQANDAGILRKKEENEKEEELLVFGYSCKLFRDDEKAQYVDQGKHLIPWMGDESLRIDRYDVRGALYDLSQYEAISGQQEELFWISLSSEERRIEQLCDEERYRALTHNEDEERLYQEEELKRLHQALGSDKTYGEVSYSYDDENGESEKPPADNQPDESDEPYVPRPELDLPTDMIIPETVKLNAIIEKTAMFINQQGLQMEIILKMKQATNPQFEFLSYRSPLHPYYRHVLGAVKSGRYKPLTTNNSKDKTDEGTVPADQNYYLHHTLSQLPTSSVDVAPMIPSINYKPSADCAYSMLVNKIRNNQNKILGKANIDAITEPNAETEMYAVKEELGVPHIVSSPKLYTQTERIDGNGDNEIDDKPSSPQVMTQRPNRRKRRKRQQGAFAYNDMIDRESLEGTELIETAAEIDGPIENMEVPEERYDIPSADLQLIIDKMACYVGKNGRNFEEIVKSKGDPRFSFLDSANQYHMYYRKKVEFFEQSLKPVDGSTDADLEHGDDQGSVNNGETPDVPRSCSKSSAAKPNPVSFSIKRPKETESLEIKSALPVEESTDDDDENEDGAEGRKDDNTESIENNTVNVIDGTSNKITVNRLVNAVKEQETLKVERVKVKLKEERVKDRIKDEHVKLKDERVKEERVKKSERKEKLKDELQVKSKDECVKKSEKQLQLERKRRAAAFLDLIQKSNKTMAETAESSIMIGPQLPDDLKPEDKSDSASSNEEDNDGSVSVTSPPSSVTSPDVTVIGVIPAGSVLISPKNRSLEVSPTRSKTKRSKYSTPEKYSSRHIRSKDDVEYKHKHRKRKRSRSPARKHHSHPGRSHVHHSGKESKHRKHHRQHRKEWRHSEREHSNSGSAHRKHKHYKQKKHKRKEEKKYASSKSNSSDDSESS